MVAEADDKLMEKFFEAGTLTQDELVAGLRTAVRARRIFPLFCTSAILNVGVQTLLDAVIAYVPAPSERPSKGTKGGQEVEVAASDSGPYAAFVWKTVADPFAGRISMFRVMSGSLKADTTVYNLVKEAPERLGHLVLLQGKTQTDVPEIKAGDIGAVAKLKETLTNDTLAERAACVHADGVRRARHFLRRRTQEPRRRGQGHSSLQRMLEEDLSLRLTATRRPRSSCSPARASSTSRSRCPLKRRFSVEVTLNPPKIPYRETIRATDVQGRHKKQTGGHGQFGDCWIRMEPLPRGGLRVCQRHLRRGDPADFRPAVEKGILETPQARLSGRLPGGGLQGDALRRFLPRCRLVRNGVQAGGPQGFKLRWSRPSRPCWNRS